MTKKGEILSDAEFAEKSIREERMKMMKEMMKKEIANRFKEEEKKEREMIKRKIEEIQKLETVFKRKVKHGFI